MAQKVVGYIKLQIPAGKATPAPPVGPALGQHGVNIMAFTKEFNERTKNDVGLIIPVVITVYADRTFSFITKTPPAAVLIKKAINLESGSGVPNKDKVATITKAQVKEIAERKMPDLTANTIEAAMSQGRGGIDGDGAFTHATLAAHDKDLVPDVGQAVGNDLVLPGHGRFHATGAAGVALGRAARRRGTGRTGRHDISFTGYDNRRAYQPWSPTRSTKTAGPRSSLQSRP